MAILNWIFGLIVVSGAFCAHVCATEVQTTPQVIGWVPAYALEESMKAIESNSKISEGLTRIGLQLWNPSADGRGLVFAPTNKSGKLVAG